jgi:hypothetical protein
MMPPRRPRLYRAFASCSDRAGPETPLRQVQRALEPMADRLRADTRCAPRIHSLRATRNRHPAEAHGPCNRPVRPRRSGHIPELCPNRYQSRENASAAPRHRALRFGAATPDRCPASSPRHPRIEAFRKPRALRPRWLPLAAPLRAGAAGASPKQWCGPKALRARPEAVATWPVPQAAPVRKSRTSRPQSRRNRRTLKTPSLSSPLTAVCAAERKWGHLALDGLERLTNAPSRSRLRAEPQASASGFPIRQ